MATIQGLRGTGSWSANERPKNYREGILYLFPNAAPLTAMTSKMKSESTDDPEFNIFTKGLPVQRATVNGSQTSGDTIIELQGSAPEKIFKKGHTVINTRTLEVIWVEQDPSVANQIVVSRGKDSVRRR